MSKLIHKSLNKFLSSGYPGYTLCLVGIPWLCPGTTFFQQINLNEKKIFFAYITNQIASKKVKLRGTGSSDQR